MKKLELNNNIITRDNMFQDVCFPKNNEKEFVKIAKALGTDSLIFVYEFINQKDLDEKKKNLFEIKEVKAELGILLNEINIQKFQKTNDYIHIFSKTPSIDVIDSKKSYILYDFEQQIKPDFLHHRNSGVNQVIAMQIKEKEKILGFSFSTYLNSMNRGVILGRMKQNTKIAKKYKLNYFVLSFAKQPYELRSKHELDAFKRFIGL